MGRGEGIGNPIAKFFVCSTVIKCSLKVSKVTYCAISLDTSAFSRNGYALESGLLKQIRQFKSGPIRFVLSEIVLNEVKKHMLEAAKTARDSYLSAQRSARELGLISDAETDSHARLNIDFREVVNRRIESFLVETNALVLPSGGVDSATLSEMYFSCTAPFENNAKKKNEFPDAIALLTLTKWGEQQSGKVLAVSTDQGWKTSQEAPSI